MRKCSKDVLTGGKKSDSMAKHSLIVLHPCILECWMNVWYKNEENGGKRFIDKKILQL